MCHTTVMDPQTVIDSFLELSDNDKEKVLSVLMGVDGVLKGDAPEDLELSDSLFSMLMGDNDGR